MNLEQPTLLLTIIPLLVVFFFLLRKQFVQVTEDDDTSKRKKKVRWIMLFTRTLIALALLTAIASPFTTIEKTIQGDPVVKILIDNSSSMGAMEAFDLGFVEKMKTKVEVEVHSVASPEVSDIGDAVLANLGPFESILLVSDGNVNQGADLGDVALFAQQINSTVHAVKLNTLVEDVAVSIDGPDKTSADVDTEFRVHTTGPALTKVTVDGSVVFEGQLDGSKAITRQFKEGYHRVVASIQKNDHYLDNNVFYKTIKAVTPPKILFVTEKGESSMLTLLRQAYEVEVNSLVPFDLDPYYAVILNDVPAGSTDKYVPTLTDYLTEGNGVVVVGGKKSYDNGGYRNSLFEKLLPVHIGSPKRKEGDNNIVLLIDISGSTGSGFGGNKAVDVEKALAINVIENEVSSDTKVGVVAFNTQAFTISDIDYLGNRQATLEDRIARLKDGGGTLIGVGMIKSLQMLETVQGSKNIILISDGRTQGENVALESIKLAANSGVRVYTVGVGGMTREHVMVQYADMTGGIYFRADDSNRLKLLFGKAEPDSSSQKQVIVLNQDHDLTRGMDNLTAKITGYNQIAPKTTGQLLISTSDGLPVLVVGRVGLGRVAAVGTDDGSAWGGELLGTANNIFHTRTIDWAIGEPDRKDKELVMIADTRVRSSTPIIVRSSKQPKMDGKSFVRADRNTYTSTITPDKIGFQEILGATFAVNYPSEYDRIGQGEALAFITKSTDGQVFAQDDVEGIVEAAKARAKRTLATRDYVRWPFILAAIIVFLLEIFIRRYLRVE
ncbi:hypothetical protein CMO91_01555 [Candidatus Woesearchaeota archaeon]|nr:hypothetical protein [Candidatus Woesearchaeota archaeon]